MRMRSPSRAWSNLAPGALIHGLGSPGGESNFRVIGPALAAAGYCAFGVDYGHTEPLRYPGGLGPLEESAAVIREFIEEVRTATGAAEVDLVGHSEGGLHSLAVPKSFGLGDVVGTVVAMAPPTHGTDFHGLLPLGRELGVGRVASPVLRLFGCWACEDIAIDGTYVAALNDGPIAQRGIDYTIIATQYDALVTPTETSFVREPGVTNIRVQDVCPLDLVGHIGMAYDDAILQMVINALDPAHAAPIDCGVGGPPV